MTFQMVILDKTIGEEEIYATKKGQTNSTEETGIGGWIGHDGQQRDIYRYGHCNHYRLYNHLESVPWMVVSYIGRGNMLSYKCVQFWI